MDSRLRFTDLTPSMLLHVRQSMSLGSVSEQAWHKPSTEPQVRDAQAIIATSADVKEYPDSYVFVIDMPGLELDDIKVEMEYGDMLVISGERKREEIEAGAEYLRMERVGKFLRKFELPKNANTDAVSSVYKDGVMTVTVQKKKNKTFKVQIG